MMSDASLIATMQSLAAQMAIFQAMLLAGAAIHKSLRWGDFLIVMRQFAGVPGVFAAVFLGMAITGELSAGALLAIPAYRVEGAALAACIWMLYGGLIVRAIVQGRRDLDCGCTFGPASSPLGFFQIARNLVLAALAVFIAAVPALPGTVSLPATHLLGGLALLALYGALDQVMALQPLRRGEAG